MKILVTEAMHDCGLNYLKNKGTDIVFASSLDENTLLKEAEGCDAIIVRAAPVTERLLKTVPSVRVIGKHGVGYENIDIDACKRAGVKVCYTPTGSTRSVAEHTLLLMLACARKFKQMHNASMNADFGFRMRVFSNEVCGKTIGQIGYGHIGSMFTEMAHNGLGMRILTYDPFIDNSILPDYVKRCSTLEEMLKDSDFVTIHLALNNSTRGMLDRNVFSQMKNTAYLINCARGGVVNEQDLIEALENGEIAGAGLDVMAKEPFPKDHPLLKMENVIITPHCGAATIEAMERISQEVAESVYELLTVDKCRGQIV